MPATPRRRPRRGFGTIRKLPSGRFQASYVGPDLLRHAAPYTFDARGYAEGWLEDERRLIQLGDWLSPAARKAAALRAETVTLRAYATQWLASRTLRPNTHKDYRHLLDNVVLPELGDLHLANLTRADVRKWWAGLDPSKPRTNAKAYALLRAVAGTAVDEEIISANPVLIRGARVSRRRRTIEPATLAQVATIAEAMPARLRLAVLLGCWCALRYGEMAELRRSDIDFDRGVIKIRRGAVWLKGSTLSGPPKTPAGARDVAFPPHLTDDIRAHLATHAQWGKDGLLFPSQSGAPISPSSFFKPWRKARLAAGRPDLRFHDLRHTGAVLAAQEGATLAELQARLGHTTPAAAMIYQHAASERDKELAERLSRRAADAASRE
jgi:integrase